MNLQCFDENKLIKQISIDDDLCRIPVTPLKQDRKHKFYVEFPIADFQGYWTPELRYPSSKIIWVIEALSAPQRSFPYLAFFNSRQENRATIALDNFHDDIRITAKINQEKCVYEVTIEVAERADSPTYTITIDRRKNLLWTAALASWVKNLSLPPCSFPAGAWDPVYCTWYVVHGAVEQNWVESTARQAVELGFKTLIIDDGWSYDEMKRVSPATIGTWYDSIGNWTVSRKKFPDFARHVQRVQALGMKYLVWTAPFLIGDKSEIFADFRAALLPERHTEGCLTFDSACRDKWPILINKLTDLIRNYQLDGLKIDFLDYIFPNLDRPRGAETQEFIAQLSRQIRELKPDALIEFRQAYATPQMLAYGTQFRAGDVPFDFTDNFARLAQIRISLGGGDGIPVHADPLYWGPEESLDNVARHLIASLAGVPMLSMELSKLSSEELQIIKFWLGFYREHQTTFNQGHWEVSYHPSGLNYQLVSQGGETIIILADAARLEQALAAAPESKIYVLNLSPEAVVLPSGQVFDRAGQKLAGNVIPGAGLGVIG